MPPKRRLKGFQYAHMEQVTGFVSLSFIATAFITFVLLILALKSGIVQIRSRALAGAAFAMLLWLLIQALLGKSGWYSGNLRALPPRIVVAGVLPALVVVFVCAFGKKTDLLTNAV
jgi:hypothetical protein